MLMLGKLIEHIDMNVRFDYKYNRIEEAMFTLDKFIAEEPELIDQVILAKLRECIADKEAYESHDAEYKNTLLNRLNRLVRI